MILYPIFEMTKRGLEVKTFYKNSESEIISIEDLIFKEFPTELKIISNFTSAKYSIIEYLLKCETLHQRETKDDKILSFEIRKNYILIYDEYKNCNTLCSFENKFMQDFSTFEIAKELEFFDNEKRASCTQDAKNKFYKQLSEKSDNLFCNRHIFKKIFPQPEEAEFKAWKDCKKTVSAFFYKNTVGEFENIYVYDISKSFPSRLYKGLFPQGKGNYFENDNQIPTKKWYIKKIRIYKATPKKYDYMNFKQTFEDNFNEPVSMYVTKEIEEVLNILYDIKYKTVFGYYYKLQKSIFDKYIEENISENPKYIRTYTKGMNNNLIGSFGENDIIQKTFYKIENETISFETKYETLEEKSFYPVYLYVNGKAKAEFLKICYENHETNIYSNTDSIFSTTPINFKMYNAFKINGLGEIEFRSHYDKLAIKDVSNFCAITINKKTGEVNYDMRLSGRQHKNVSYFDFINGFKSVVYSVSEYGFIQPIKFEELSLDYFIKYEDYLKKMKFLNEKHYFTINDYHSKTMFQNIEWKQKQKEFMDKICDNFETLSEEELKSLEEEFYNTYSIPLSTRIEQKKKQEYENSQLEIPIPKTRYFTVKKEFIGKRKKYHKYDFLTSEEITPEEIEFCLKKKLIEEKNKTKTKRSLK